MNAIEALLLVRSEKIGGTNVGGQHAFFDHPVSVIAHDRHNVFNFALLIEKHLRFSRLEINRPALRPSLV
ncbi:MAG: hypothetical protein ACD_10C00851G0002 [uncultured bacterium]|nr:MAG: hypothetical protein ACD_10C00851G0002 [uncultured bacterium]